jgi:hypothetical protein
MASLVRIPLSNMETCALKDQFQVRRLFRGGIDFGANAVLQSRPIVFVVCDTRSQPQDREMM